MIVCLIAGCAAKKQWQGKYTTVSYTRIEPKEDFKVWEYIVIAYDVAAVDKYSGVLYRFEIMYNNDKLGALEVCDASQDIFGYIAADGYKYVLVAGDAESERAYAHSLHYTGRLVHRKYKMLPIMKSSNMTLSVFYRKNNIIFVR